MKIVAAFLGVVCVVATPREAFPVFGGYLLQLAAVWTAARIVRRHRLELPFGFTLT